MNIKRVITAVVGLMLLGGGSYWGYQQLAAADTGTAVILSPAPADNRVSARGQVMPAQAARLALPAGGQVAELLVAAGDRVAAGDPLLRLDSAAEERAMAQAETAVSQAEANLAAARTGLQLAQLGLSAKKLDVQDAAAALALLHAGPGAARIKLSEQLVAIAAAGVTQAVNSQQLLLEGAPSPQLKAAEAQLQAAEVAYQTAQLQYNPILQHEDSSDTDRELAGYRLNAAGAAVTAARAALDQLLSGATAAARTAAASGITAASRQQDGARAQLELMLAGVSPEQLRLAELALQQTENSLPAAELDVTRAEIGLTQAEAALAEAEVALALAGNSLEKRTLTAPFAGTVARLMVKQNEVAAAGMPLLILADVSRWQIETTDLTEFDVAEVQIGQLVAIQLDAFPGVTLAGRVTEIGSVAGNSFGDVVYPVTIHIEDEAELVLRWGMTARLDLITDETKTAGSASRTVLSPAPVVAEGRLEPAAFVTLAFSSGGNVAEILVTAGDTVQAGDPLIRLEASGLELALSRAELAVTMARIGVQAAENGVALAETAVLSVQDGVALAQANLDWVQAGPRPAEITAAEAALAAANAAVGQASASREVALDMNQAADLAAANAALLSATADLRQLEEQYQTILDSCFETPTGEEFCPLYGAVEEQTRRLLTAARAAQAAAQAQVDFLNGGATPGQQAAAGSMVTIAAANRELAQAQLDLLLTGVTPERVAQAELGVARAQLGVELAQLQVAQAETAVLRAQAALQAAQIGYEQLADSLARMTLTATMDGTVAEIRTEPGELLAPGMGVVTLADFSRWQLQTTDLTELDIVGVTEGDVVDLTFDAFPNQPLAGTILSVAHVSERQLGDILYQVTIQLTETDSLPLRWGLTALVEGR